MLVLGAVATAPLTAQVAPATDDTVIELSPFEVSDRSGEGYTANEATTGTIIALSRNAIPFNTSVVTSEMLSDLNITNASDISEVIAGVSRDTDPYISDEQGQSSLGFRVRGFSNTPLYNGFQTGGRILSPNNLGRIEVSKGPNAVLYGQAPAGGVINFVPKRPQFNDHGSVELGIGGNGWMMAGFELGGPLKTEALGKAAAFRIGANLLEFEREQIYFENSVFSSNAALTWQLNDVVTLDLQGEYTEVSTVPARTAAFVSTGSGPDRVVDPFNRLRNDRNFTYNGPYSLNKNDVFLGSAYVNFSVSDSVTLRVGGFYSSQGLDSNRLTTSLHSSESGSANYIHWDQPQITRAAKADLLHEGQWGELKINSLLGFEVNHQEVDTDEIRTPSNYTVTIPFSRKPLVSDWPKPPPRNEYTVLRRDEFSTVDWTNARFSQFISAPNDQWTAMWGIARGDGDTFFIDRRNGNVARSEGSDTTYTAGGTFKFTDELIAFANYSTSFEIQGGNQQNPDDFLGFPTVAALTEFISTRPPNPLDPQTGGGFEVGLRSELLESRLSLTALYFDQTRENIARSFFVRESFVGGVTSEDVLATYSLASGEENAKGIELSADWFISEAWVFTASAQFSDGEVVSNPEAPQEEGFGLVRSPEDMVSVWTKYDFAQDSALQGLSLGLGASYNSSTRIRPNFNDLYRVSDPYTNVRLMVRYGYEGFGLQHSITLNVENLLDEEYTKEDNFLSEPRLFRLVHRTQF